MADVIIDYVNAIPMTIKYSSRKTEEAKLIELMAMIFLDTINKLVKGGKIKRYGFRKYQLINKN